MNKNLTVGEIRVIIYEECVRDKEGYESPDNIIVKFRGKKNSKLLVESQ